MAFTQAVLSEAQKTLSGEVIKVSPHNTSAFDVFEDGLVEGRFCKFDAGSIDNLDASATPTIAGVAKRKVTGEIGTGIYSTTGQEYDSVAEVVNFGFVTVDVTAAAVPTKYAQVYAHNVADAEAGAATQDATGTVAVPDCVFWEPKADGVWLVRIGKFL